MKNYKVLFVILLGVILMSSCGQKYGDGKLVYDTYCENCHMEDGKGLEELYPPLANSDYLRNGGAAIACLIRNGAHEKMLVNGIEFNNAMPANPKITLIEMTNLLNYINNAWGNSNGFTNMRDIETVLDACQPQ
ncbi:MAG: cytochrome c [Saprospiraceae bacterium]|nr:cytochrome c [Saprospiraceae bacterium]